jgi:acyl carrier protein
VSPDQKKDAVRDRIQVLLQEVLELDPGDALALSDGVPLFGSGLSLDSRTGMALLSRIQHDFGVDVASEDLYLDCLQTVGTLVQFLTRSLDSEQPVPADGSRPA